MDNIIVEASKFHSNSAVVTAELKSSVATDDFLRILDDHVKKPHETPYIGIVLCKSSNKELVEYVIQDYHKPMGVATYKTSAEMPENLKKALPDIEELRKLLGNSFGCRWILTVLMNKKSSKTHFDLK